MITIHLYSDLLATLAVPTLLLPTPSKELFRIQLHQIVIRLAYRCHFLLFITVVIACLTTTPALSISRFDNPLVTQTFRAGCGRHSFMRSLGVAPIARGMAFRRVMRTPFVRACE